MTNPNNEIYYSGENNRSMYDTRSPEASEVFNQVLVKFPWTKLDNVFAVSSSLFHEILEEEVITFILSNHATKNILGKGYRGASRKYCMTSATSFLKAYTLWGEETPSFLPETCTTMFRGVHMEEYKRPAPKGLEAFYDCYFRGDPAVIEEYFDLPERRGAYGTYYGATIHNGNVVRVKQYVYDSPSAFAHWEVEHLIMKKEKEQSDKEATDNV